jgi:hypothetical protein
MVVSLEVNFILISGIQFSLNSDSSLSVSSDWSILLDEKVLALHVDTDGRITHDRRTGFSDTFRSIRPQDTACAILLCSIRLYINNAGFLAIKKGEIDN